jgi:hypothetical protein
VRKTLPYIGIDDTAKAGQNQRIGNQGFGSLPQALCRLHLFFGKPNQRRDTQHIDDWNDHPDQDAEFIQISCLK